MNKFLLSLYLISLLGVLASACSDDDPTCTESLWYEDADGDGLGNPNVSQESCTQPSGYVSNMDDDDDSNSSNAYQIDASFFQSSSLLSFNVINCTLSNGSSTTCYEIKFTSNPVEHGPYCPKTIDEIGGVGIYDGASNPGFQVMKRSLWEAMEADGYDIVDANGNITVVDPGDMSGPPPSGGACLEASPDDDLTLTFVLPMIPEVLSTPDVLGTVEHIGVSLEGIPLTGDPPSATQSMGGMPGGGGAIPSIDPCGGHIDPFGYYHLHFAPQDMANIYENLGITEVACTNFEQDDTALVGFAKDGYPIYASKEENGSLPADLDACNGHFGPTPHFPEGVYHYHASSSDAPNVPPCLIGASVNNAFSYQ